jgi:peptidoglycan/xylan/chitin deacetylase (PgdA/CDA1 family)
MCGYRPGLWSLAVVIAVMLAGGMQHDKMPGDSAIVKSVQTTEKLVALTFDDGPHYKTTPLLLRILEEKQVKATFFVLGVNVAQHPELVAQEVAAGHEIGNHAFSHKLLSKMDASVCAAELDRAEQGICKVAPRPVLFRPPGGAYNHAVLAEARRRGYTTVIWSIDTRDWSRPPVGQVIKIVLAQVKPGSIVLMHDGQDRLPTPEALGEVIDGLREQGYTFVTVSELLEHSEVRK